MKISCPTCAAKYSVADEKIQARLAKIRCRKCNSTIVIDGTASPANVYIGDASVPASASAPPQDQSMAEPAPGSPRFGGVGFSDPTPADPVGPAPDEYAVDIADNDQRNMTVHQIVGAYNEGLITADTYIWKEGMADWQRLAEVREVAEALHAAAARPVGSAPAAAVRHTDHRGAADLFGRIETAGGEDDITTSAPEPAPAITAGTGARNESSVLFSLSALTGAAEAAASSSTSKRKTSSDDSGLIDLQALTASDPNAGAMFSPSSPAGAFGASPLISAPLGGVSGPALGAALTPDYGRRTSGRMGLIVAASVLAVGIIGGAAVIVNKGGAEPTSSLEPVPAAAASAAAAAPAALPEPSPEATTAVASAKEKEKEEAEEPKAARADDEDSVAADELPAAPAEEPKTSKRAPRRASRPAPRPKPAPAAAPAPDPEPPAPKPAAKSSSKEGSGAKKKKKKSSSRCECKPADLMCAMRCSARR